ncbi:SCO0607 family lipoprotein [Streptomyces sp. RK9]|uniref:SCO0607 family lipoprotein n=1 Tax=Streptomyces sp. RK9 TaxID=3239284 RepID=UPI00386CC3DD
MLVSRRSSRPTAASRRRVRPVVAVALAGGAALMALTGCSALDFKEDVCMGDEYPVMTVNGTGSACVSNDDKPPSGYVRYPEGKVPKHVDDKWDVYWRTHTLDENGKIIDDPDADEAG